MKKLLFNPSREELKEYMELAEKYDAAFEYDDFMYPNVLDDDDKVEELISLYKNLGRDMSEDTLHGAFLDICVSSTDSLIFQASDKRVRQSMDIAKKLGVKAVIFHTNCIANFKLPYYMNNWLYGNAKYWKKILEDYKDISIYIENMFDMDHDLIEQLAGEMADEERFGICLDIAHANISNESIEVWMNALLKYVKHMHINDNRGSVDSHNAMGDGNIEWNLYNEALRKEKKDISVLLEMNGTRKLKDSLKYMEENGIYPFEKR